MSDVRIAPGWYDDPARPGGLRWYDGDAWTDHVSARPEPLVQAPPQTVHPAYASPPAATGTYEVRPVSAAALAPRPAPPRRRTGLVVALVAVLLAVVGIGWYAVSSLTSGSGTAPVAAAPSPTAPASAKKAAAVTLGTTAPAKVAGLSRSKNADLVQTVDEFRAEFDKDFSSRAGARPSKAAAYGTRAHFVFILWATTPIDEVRDAVDGELGLQSLGARAISTSHLAGGATQVCGLIDVPGTRRTITECLWLRPGTGVVALLESDSTGTTVSRHMKALVAALTHR